MALRSGLASSTPRVVADRHAVAGQTGVALTTTSRTPLAGKAGLHRQPCLVEAPAPHRQPATSIWLDCAGLGRRRSSLPWSTMRSSQQALGSVAARRRPAPQPQPANNH
jgi:hypothetical protein